MNLKKLFVMTLCIFLLTLAFSGVAKAVSEETQNVYHIEYGGLIIDVTAPIQAYPGETINITVTTQAITQINVEYIYVTVYGYSNAITEITLRSITHVVDSSLTFHEATYNITIPEDISPGLTYGSISCEWDFMGSNQEILPSGFALTYIQNIQLELLQAEYDELNATHQSVIQNYTALESTYSELESNFNDEVDSTRTLMYIFVATTVVASITVIVLLMRKPQKIWI